MFRLLLVLPLLGAAFAAAPAQEVAPLTIVVMDPLALPLSCPCVKGYAQRDYDLLGKHLAKELGRPVNVHFSESLAVALEKKTGGKVDLIIGKESIVRLESKSIGLKTTPILSLTGKDGKTLMTGLFVVASADPALTLSDLKEHRLLFGPANADEKHSAALALLRDFEIAPPKTLETVPSCSTGATKVLELHKEGARAAAVISSYAQPLLEGCGTIKKGELRVVGETDPVPFIVAFVSDRVSAADRDVLERVLLMVGEAPKLRTALETKHGFVRFEAGKKK